MGAIQLGITICPFMSFHGEGVQYCREDCVGYYHPYGNKNMAMCAYVPGE